MGHRRPNAAWIFWVKNFGFISKRKYGFLHSTWETIIARRTGTTYSLLDYVVYRLFYVLTLCGVSVYKLSQVNPLPFLLYLETWSLFIHTIYSFLFLRQVLVHNHHHKALGRRQKMPDQLVITDEIEKDGHKYYISKKISVLPRENLSAYEKLVWVMFNISATMSFLCFVGTHIFSSFLVRNNPKGKNYPPPKYNHFLLIIMGLMMTIMDIAVNTIPVRLGHFIHSVLFCLVYFFIAYLHDTTKNRVHLYQRDIWAYPTNLKILGLAIPCHIAVMLLSQLRDFIVSLLDRSRTSVNQQKVRSQKRLARRKIMVPIHGPDGKVNKIILEHGNPTQEDWIYWKDGFDDENIYDWAGDSDSDKERDEGNVTVSKVDITSEGEGGGNNEVVPELSSDPKTISVNKMAHPTISFGTKRYGPPPDLTATIDEKPVVKGKHAKIEDIRLPSPPKKVTKKDVGTKISNVKLHNKVVPAHAITGHAVQGQVISRDDVIRVTHLPSQTDGSSAPPKEHAEHKQQHIRLETGPPVEFVVTAANPKKDHEKHSKLPHHNHRPRPRSPPTPPKQKPRVRNMDHGILRNFDEEQPRPSDGRQEQVLDAHYLDQIGAKALLLAHKREYQAKRFHKSHKIAHPEKHLHPKRDSHNPDEPPVELERPAAKKHINYDHAGDADYEAERRKYAKLHRGHEIDRMTYHNQQQLVTENKGAADKKKGGHGKSHPRVSTGGEDTHKAHTPQNRRRSSGERNRRTTLENDVLNHLRLHQQKKVTRNSGGGAEGEDKMKEGVYDPGVTPQIPNATTSYHLLGARLDRRGEEGKLGQEQVSELRKHPGIHTLHKIEVQPAPNKKKTVANKEKEHPLKEKESKVAFHPLVKFFDIPHPPSPPEHDGGRRSYQRDNHDAAQYFTKPPNSNRHKFDHFEPDTQYTGHLPPDRKQDEDDYNTGGRQ